MLLTIFTKSYSRSGCTTQTPYTEFKTLYEVLFVISPLSILELKVYACKLMYILKGNSKVHFFY